MAASIDKITSQALGLNKTTDLAGQRKNIKEMIKKIETAIKKNKIKATICLGGSAAKDTFLGDNFDIDIFVMFDYKRYKDQDLSLLLKKALKPFNPETIHGSRDYFKIDKRYEIVPVLKISKPQEVVNVTDASPLHVQWVRRYAKKNPKLNAEIKLVKMFFKGCGVYGAESYIKGMSGHVTDILVTYYGSFKKTIQSIAKWKQTTEIDIEKHKGILDKAKIVGPLTVIDPIQPNRNAAAAVSKESYELLKKTAKSFLKNPTLDYFREKVLEPDNVGKEYNLILKVGVTKGKIDIVGAKLLKTFEFMNEKLKEFGVEKSDWWWNKEKDCYLYFKLTTRKLPDYFEKSGPSKEYPEHILRFKQKYKDTYDKDGLICAKVRRDITDLNLFIQNITQDPYLKEKTKGIEIVK